MKRICFVIILLCILLSCNNNEKTVSVFVYNKEDIFINEMSNYLRSAFPANYKVNIYDSQNFQITQNELIESRIKAKDDLVIINPVDRTGVYSIIKKLRQHNIPVIFFNREPLSKDMNLWDKVYYVGCKIQQAPILQAELVERRFGIDPENLNEYDTNGNGVIEAVIIKGEQGHQDAEIRTSGVVKTLEDHGYKMNILDIEVANWSRLEAYEKMEPVLIEFNTQIELVIANNDAMAIGAVTIMRQKGLFNNNNLWIPVVGIDGLKETKDYIDDGYIYGTILNNSMKQSEAIVNLTEFILNNKNRHYLKFPLIKEKYILIDYQILQ